MSADPMTVFDEAEYGAQQDEALREARWAEFTGWLRQASIPVVLRSVADLMQDQRDPYRVSALERILNFQETEGWAGVLSAVARVQGEKERRS